jgi:hypothetical protein
MGRRITTMTLVLTTMALLFTLVAAGAATATKKDKKGGEGCTPGYWKNHTSSWQGFTTGQDFDAVFGVDIFSPNRTLLVALQTGGGGADALGRHAVAALLSASHSGVDYGLTAAQVIAVVQAADASNDFEGAKNILAALNESDCPLN